MLNALNALEVNVGRRRLLFTAITMEQAGSEYYKGKNLYDEQGKMIGTLQGWDGSKVVYKKNNYEGFGSSVLNKINLGKQRIERTKVSLKKNEQGS